MLWEKRNNFAVFYISVTLRFIIKRTLIAILFFTIDKMDLNDFLITAAQNLCVEKRRDVILTKAINKTKDTATLQKLSLFVTHTCRGAAGTAAATGIFAFFSVLNHIYYD